MTDILPSLTFSELADLKAKAKAATPGPWRCCEPSSNFQKGKLLIRPATSEKLISVVGGEARFAEKRANGDHIAAANPETILRLIDMIERRDGQIEKLREALGHTITIIEAAHADSFPDWRPGFDDIELTPDGEYRISQAREALAATEPPR